ncbi:MAG: ABC transporter substrate-binding protein [Acidimicrobiia bacterium]
MCALRTRRRASVAAALVLSAALAVAACGDAGRGSATPAADPTVSDAAAPHVEPCGPGAAGPSPEIGVTADAISVGVVADVNGARAQFLANWQAMQAFAAYCNSVGGIAGRRLDVRLFDTNVFNHRQAIEDSCASVFALVGSASAFDGDGSSIESDCGIPDVPALVAEPAHERVPTVVAPLPSPQNLFLVGPQRYLARLHRAAVRRAGMAYLDVGVTALRATRQLEASRAVGYRFTSVDPVPALYTADQIDELAARLVARHVRYLAVQGRVTDLATIQTALAQRGAHPEVVDAGPLFYDPGYLQQAGAVAEGTYVVTQTAPFGDTPVVPELARYTEWLARTVPGATPTAQGARSWSAGLLFAEAARRASEHLDRSTVLAQLRSIHAWDGNGIQVPSDPGAARTSSCFAYLQVRDGRFERAYPSHGFSCPRDGWLHLRRDFHHL